MTMTCCYIHLLVPVVFGLLAAIGTSLQTLPSYDNPLVISPHLDQTILDRCCKLSHNLRVIKDANLTSLNQLWSNNYKQDKIEKLKHVVLQFDGSVSGVQYDRVGAVWVNGIELLRTTTPEPSTIEGDVTSWRIERDVTDYINVLTGDGDNIAAISIPNTVNEEYTGVLHVNVSLAFYVAKDGGEKEGGHPVAINLEPDVIDQTRDSNQTSVWSTISFTTNSMKNFTIEKKDLVHRLSSFASLGAVYLDVHASAHSDEEFYYTKPVNTTCLGVNETGCISGGPLRFLQVRIDGQLAGSAIPFPTVYTGGINPLLWRPLTGINSFDVLPVRFDLTPFGGVFDRVLRANNPERETTIQLEVATGEQGHVLSVHDGVWFVDASLLFVPSNERAGVPSPARFDSVTTSTVSPLSVAVDQILTQQGQFDIVHMPSPHIFSVVASSSTSGDKIVVTFNVNSTGLLLVNEAEGRIGSSAETKDSGRDFEFGYLRQEVVTTTHEGDSWLQHNSTSFYSYKSDTFDGTDETTFDLNATVTWSRSRFEEYSSSENEDMLDVFWGNSVQAAARYNRSLTNHTDLNIAMGQSHETFAIVVPPNDNVCYDAKLTAVNGSLIGEGNARIEYVCHLPNPLYFCGAEICGLAEYNSLFWKNIAKEEETFGQDKSARARRHWLGSFFFFTILFGSMYALYIKRHDVKDTFSQICMYLGIDELMRRRRGGDMHEPLIDLYGQLWSSSAASESY